MKQLIILLIEFILIIGIVTGIYMVNLTRKPSPGYIYTEPLMSTQMNLADLELREELNFFLSKELGLFEGEFDIVNVVFLYTQKLSGADYILITLKAYDGRLFQITISRNSLPWSRWQLNRKAFNVIEPLTPLLDTNYHIPKWMVELGVTQEQLDIYLSSHPDAAFKGDSAFFDKKTQKFTLPDDWHKTVFSFVTDKDKTTRLIPDTKEKAKQDLINSYWKADYPKDYLGPDYRGYLYKKIKQEN